MLCIKFYRMEDSSQSKLCGKELAIFLRLWTTPCNSNCFTKFISDKVGVHIGSKHCAIIILTPSAVLVSLLFYFPSSFWVQMRPNQSTPSKRYIVYAPRNQNLCQSWPYYDCTLFQFCDSDRWHGDANLLHWPNISHLLHNLSDASILLLHIHCILLLLADSTAGSNQCYVCYLQLISSTHLQDCSDYYE